MNKLLISLFLFLFFALSFFASGAVDSQDGQLYLAVARYIYYTGHPTAPPYEFSFKGESKNIHMGTYLGRDGKTTYSPTGLGYSLALLPAVAVTDFAYKFYGLTPQLEHFPLESDWLILFTASLTNPFFGAMLGVILFAYFLELGLNKKSAFVLTLVSIFATNLWPYTKHSFAHMMFISFLVLSFFLIKKYARTGNKKLLLFSGISFGVTTITYNQTFSFSFIPLIIYYLLLTNFKGNKKHLFKATKDLGIFILGLIPFLIIFFWFEYLRYRVWTAAADENFIRQYKVFFHVPLSVFIEGIYGQLLSPGRSFFIYSPILIIPGLFWDKIKKIRAEVIVFIILSLTYLFFFASLYVIEEPKYGPRGLWDGEFSWGPRYLTALIPFGMLITANIYSRISKKQLFFFFYPLVLIGLYVNFLGIFLPYQIKLNGLAPELILNGQKYTSYTYSNLFPRYNPILIQTHNLISELKRLPKTLDHGEFNIRLNDGFDFPFQAGPERFRSIEAEGHIKFDSSKKINRIALNILNQPILEGSNSALTLNISLNKEPIAEEKLNAGEKREITIPIDVKQLLAKDNDLTIKTAFEEPSTILAHSQITILSGLKINNESADLETLDYPFVSALGPPITGTTYETYGGEIKNPWKIWEIHSQIYERTPDLWWVKPLYYWDLPKGLFLLLFLGNLSGLLYSGYRTIKLIKN